VRKAAVLSALALFVGLVATKPAQAHRLFQKKHETNLHFANRIVHHAETGILWIRQHPTRYHSYQRYSQALRNHKWLLSYGRELQKKFKPHIVRVQYPAHYTDWLCIHNYEGSWTAATGNGYYGGLQMDWSFMSAYGRRLLELKGPANNWTPLEQMWVAERAFQSGRGFYPWPNTARMCGLI
jgi:hypothetical protein